MKNWTWIVLLVLALTANLAQGRDWLASLAGNDEQVKLFVGHGDARVGSIGPVVAWHEGVDHAVWQAGLGARLDVSEKAQTVIEKLGLVPGSWWTLLQELEARVHLTAEIGATASIHLTHLTHTSTHAQGRPYSCLPVTFGRLRRGGAHALPATIDFSDRPSLLLSFYPPSAQRGPFFLSDICPEPVQAKRAQAVQQRPGRSPWARAGRWAGLHVAGNRRAPPGAIRVDYSSMDDIPF